MNSRTPFVIPQLLDEPSPEFQRQAGLLLGKTDPLGAVTVFDARELGESEEAVTLVHERAHQTLFRLTGLGHLTNCLGQFAEAGYYKDEYTLLLQEQTTVQELTAYYISLSWSARRSATQYEATWAKTSQKYQSLLEPVLNVLPLKGVSDGMHVLARGLIVEAVARSAFNGRCLGSFSDPERFNVETVREYLSAQSSHRRFIQIFNSLMVNPGFDKLEDHVVDVLGSAEEKEPEKQGLQWLLWTIPSILPPDIFVANLFQMLGGLFNFAESWQKKAQTLNVKLVLPAPSLPKPEIVQSPEYMQELRQKDGAPKELRKEVLQFLVHIATRDRAEIYLWIYMKKEEEVYLTAFLCGLDDDGRPRLDAFARFSSGTDVIQGVIRTEDAFRILDGAPRRSIVAIFYRSSWLFWNVACNKRTFDAFAKIGCIEVDLTKESLALILAFRDFYKFDRGSSWFGSDMGENVRMGYLLSAEQADTFAILRLGSAVATNVFVDFVNRKEIPAAGPGLLIHKRMLEVASMPIWEKLVHDRNPGGNG